MSNVLSCRWSIQSSSFAALVGACAIAGTIFACGGGKPAPESAAGKRDPASWPKDDRSMCQAAGRRDIEVSEVTGTGSLRPNIRRVYKVLGDAEHLHKVIECREIDTNLDGIKDVVRTYNPKGEPQHEEADRDYDGKIDVWVSFAEGRMAEVHEDTNRDGRPDTWKFYNEGVLVRVKRDRNHDGRPDVWEMYARGGRLERRGVDDNYDGQVDRWDRDDQMVRDAEEAERKAQDEAKPASDAGASTAAQTPDASGWRVE
jgi:hypothetical protein